MHGISEFRYPLVSLDVDFDEIEIAQDATNECNLTRYSVRSSNVQIHKIEGNTIITFAMARKNDRVGVNSSIIY